VQSHLRSPRFVFPRSAMAASMQAILSMLFVTVRASTFLGAHPQIEMVAMPIQEIEQAFFAELSASSADRDQRIRTLEQDLHSLFAAMPKNGEGKLDPTVVRYALHRYFAHKYGWHLRGLGPVGGSWNASSPSSIMKDRAPSYIQSLVEERMQGRGLGLRDLAILAATLTDLIRQEAVSDLEGIYATMQFSEAARLSSTAIDTVLEMFLMSYIKGSHTQKSAPADFKRMEEELIESCIVWFEAKSWIQDLRLTLDYTQQAGRNPFSQEYTFDHASEVAQEIGHRFGHFQNLECHALKEQLVDMEHDGSGRVTLAKFYSGIDDRDWPFIESPDYLRNLGALDETDPSRPCVIIPNFLSSPSNCVAPSSFYSVCCIDECEGLMAHVELAIGEPSATTARLVEVVSALESETVEAPRNLSSAQYARLEEIATFHGGHVPLHGRLFAQWMHHAYPRECRFPHEAGTTNPLNQEEFMKQFGMDAEASDEEVYLHITNKTSVAMEVKAPLLPWTSSEELIAPHSHRRHVPEAGPAACSPTRVLVFLGALASAVLPLARASKSLSPTSDKKERYLV